MSDAVKSPVVGRLGYLILDRERTLNALDLDMCQALTTALQGHIDNPSVTRILIRSGNARAFCAGGDMKRIREQVLADELHAVDRFFEIEYALNLAIAECSKPYIALIDGIAMGGGLGVSVHGSHRLLTERAVLAMPETRIGLFPDVGGTYFLPRLAHRAGWCLGLSSEAVRGHDGVTLGLGTHRIDSSSISTVCHALETSEASVDDIMQPYTLAADADGDAYLERLQQRAPWFASNTLSDTLTALDSASSEDAHELAKRIRAGSPAARDLTLKLFEQNATASLAEALAAEYDAVRQAIRHHDFAEGVRAVLVDKDHTPQWQ